MTPGRHSDPETPPHARLRRRAENRLPAPVPGRRDRATA
jgi:hypothetical protein